MQIIKAGYEILTPLDGAAVLKHIERIGRVCYKSEDKITEESAHYFVKILIERGHEAMIEHFNISVKFICDRGVSHEIVRHRIASFAQESTRYCNYGNSDDGCTFIIPFFLGECPKIEVTGDTACMKCETVNCNRYRAWKNAMEFAEKRYLELLSLGATTQEARSVLPNSLKTEIVMTTNLREWRHFFKLRCATTAHLQLQEVALPLLAELQRLIPVVFDDISV
jgi:thymidylate synthase (FAD)